MTPVNESDLPTAFDLAVMSEREFDEAMELVATHDPALERFVDLVIEKCGGTYELAGVRALDPCLYDHAHTRDWCGQVTCRRS